MLYPFVDVKQGAEGINFTAISSILAIPLVLGFWLLWAGGGLKGLFGGGADDYVIPTVQFEPTSQQSSFDAFAMFEVQTNTPGAPAAGRMITSVPSPTPLPTEWIFEANGWSARGCNTEFPGFVSCGTGENCIETEAGWIDCDQLPVDPASLPTALPSPYFITVTPTLADGHAAEAYLGD